MRDPRLRWGVLLALAIVAVSCKGDTKKQADPASAAGDVREVTGAVSASRDGVTRALAVDDTVAAGERVTTGPDGDVIIELRHNHVRWHLGPDQAKTPMEAAAWSAPPPAAGEVSGDRTSVAGRHAERAAAQTTSGAVATMGGTSGSGTSAGSGSDAPPRPKRDEETRRKVDRPEPKGDPTPTLAPCDEVACVLEENPSPCCAKYKKDDGGDDDEPASDLPETLGKDDITAGIDPIKSRIEACRDKFPDAPDRVKLKIKVSSSGSVSSVSAVDEIDEALEDCLEAAVKKAKFIATQNGGTFTFPATL